MQTQDNRPTTTDSQLILHQHRHEIQPFGMLRNLPIVLDANLRMTPLERVGLEHRQCSFKGTSSSLNHLPLFLQHNPLIYHDFSHK